MAGKNNAPNISIYGRGAEISGGDINILHKQTMTEFKKRSELPINSNYHDSSWSFNRGIYFILLKTNEHIWLLVG